MTVRYYSSTAIETTLMSPITGSTTVISVAATTGFPGTTPFTLALDYESATNELVDVTMIAGTNLTVTRGVDGTSATSHNAGARVRHVTSARDETDSRTHENSANGIHGLAPGDVIVGTNATQTLHNKTLDKATGDLKRIDIFNGPGWTTTVIGDSTDPTRSKFFVLDNEINLDALAVFGPRGQINQNMRSDFTTSDIALAINTRQASTGDKSVIRAASTSGTVFQVFDDGRTDINQIGNVGDILDVKSSASNTFAMTRWLDSTATVLASVGADGRFVLTKGQQINGTINTGAIVLQVRGLAGQTGNLQEWQTSTPTTVAFVDPAGNANFKGGTFTGVTVNGNLSVTGVGLSTTVVKPTTTARASTTVLANDPALVVPVVANATYELSGWLAYNGIASAAGDFKVDWTVPAGTNFAWARNGYISNSVNQTDTVVTDEVTIRVLGTFGVITTVSAPFKGIVTTAGTAGNLQLRWAQNVSSATATSLVAGSYIKIERVA